MPFRTFPILFSSAARLLPPRHFEKNLRRFLRHLPPEEGDRAPAVHTLQQNASFLHARYLSAREQARALPPLPGKAHEPYLLTVCRDICSALPLHAGRIIFSLRTAYSSRELTDRELSALPCTLACALMEQADDCLAKAQVPLSPEDALSLQQRCALLIQALHTLPTLPFAALEEHLSPVAALLRQDETYPRMDLESRRYYRAQAARLARVLRQREAVVAQAALTLAKGEEGPEKEAGYYLLERPEKIANVVCPRRLFLLGKPSFFLYALPLMLSALGLCAVWLMTAAPLWLLPPALIAQSEIARYFYFRLLRRLYPARMLPRLHKKHLDGQRLLVVIPTLLTGKKHALQMAARLNTLRAATPHAHFMLLADFPDAPQAFTPADRETLQAAAAAVDALNNNCPGTFLYLHRARTWDEGQQAFTGRERKRGALEALNRLLCGDTCGDTFLHASVPPETLSGKYHQVITLDADTFLPPGAAKQLQGALCHPLQMGRIAVIQPRMEHTMEHLKTRTQRILSSAGGPDAYHTLVPHVYQDVFGRGSFAGKGIYDPALFLARTGPVLPPGRILSHDLIEGEFARAATAEDIVFTDAPPAKVSGWQKRLHRWTRGDWQLLPFLFDGRLSPLSRWKIYDNLRSSLVAAAQLILLLSGAFLQNPLLMLLGLPYPLQGLAKRLLVLPGKALTQLDAAARALYRQYVSKQQLLSWVTAAQAESGGLPLYCLLGQLAAGAVMVLFSLLPGAPAVGVIPGLVWLASPLFREALDREISLPALTGEEENLVRTLCRDTWHFFEKNVHAGTGHLPPDNVQKQPEKGPAMRTSPTNIGLYLLSVLSARELSFITTAQMARRMLRTVETLEKLEKWKGHLYNWYDLETLAPLAPKFVSTVDSGNLCACLLACAQGARHHLPEMDDAGHTLPARLDRLAAAMDFTPLYDPALALFRIGYDAGENSLTPGHYNLLASECRLTSYVAVMQRQVPLKHWYALGRQATRQGGGAALLSWGGTAFEYMMPGLLLPLFENTLLGDGCRSAIRAQMAAAGRKPFGISESGYYAFDPDMHYQYRAFGLPALAVSDETKGSVVAPYASMLCLPFFPRAAIENLKHMRRLSWYDEDGLFEAADYSPNRLGGTPRLVESHMAHHQGMVLCAGCNLLTKFSLVRHFMTPAPARAYSFLLCEKKPPLPPFSRPLPQPAPQAKSHEYAFPAGSNFPISAHALRGRDTTWLVGSQGQGLLLSGNLLWTRFHRHTHSGPQFYIRNCGTGAYIRPQASGQMIFENGRVRMPFSALSAEGEMDFFVLPLTGDAVARVRLKNKGNLEMEAEVISFLEVTLSPYEADAAHPNFRDLSVLVEQKGENGLLCRRLSADGSRLPALLHRVEGPADALFFQGDRLLFLGREGNYAHPCQLKAAPEKAKKRLGAVIAPCLSIRARLRIPPGKEACLHFITGTVMLPADPPLPSLSAALSLCPLKDAMTLSFLGISPASMPLYSRMLGSLCFPGQPHHAHPPAPMDTLYRYGISGREPLCTLFLRKKDKGLLQHALSAHALFEQQGIRTVLLILCDSEKEDYHCPLQSAASQAIQQLKGCRERIVVAPATQREALQVKTLSALYLESGTPLSAQLAALSVAVQDPQPILTAHPQGGPAPSLSFAGPFGGFTPEGDYCIIGQPPAPWHNILMGRRFGTLVCENAVLHSFADNSHLNRITAAPSDVHRPQGAEEVLVRKGDGPFHPLTGGTVFHRPGLTEYHTRPEGIKATLALFSHPDLPLGLRTLHLLSEGETTAEIRILTHFAMGGGRCACEKAAGAAYASFAGTSALGFAHVPESEVFLLQPIFSRALRPEECPSGGSTALFRRQIALHPHQPFTLTWVIGREENREAADTAAAQAFSQGAGQALRQIQTFWQKKTEGLLLFGAAPWLQLYMNKWLPYQARCARLLARTGPYQGGGAFGFRDQLQDLLCCLHTDAPFARSHLLLCAAHQYQEGDVQHWWHAPRTGVRTRISDDKLFLPFMTALYAEITGDRQILEEHAPFLVSAPLEATEDDRYETPALSEETASLHDHCLLALRSVALGPHGLPQMGSGDWNDGMNNVQGESVWLGFFLCTVLAAYAPLCPPPQRDELLSRREQMMKALACAWTGEWYLRAYYHTGEALGGPHTHPPRIDLISQAFACLAGAPRENVRRALGHTLRALYLKEPGMVKLLHPPFSPREQAGYIGAYVPGVRENGGQYTHAVPWLIMALVKTGDYENAWEIARQLLPLFHTDTSEKARQYRLEPYVLCGDVYAGENLGRGGWSWYTGSAAWLYYVYLTVLLGFEKRGGRVRLAPCPHPDMAEFTLVYRYGSTSYHLTAGRDILFATLDGEKIKDGWAFLQDDGKTHEARFPWRKN